MVPLPLDDPENASVWPDSPSEVKPVGPGARGPEDVPPLIESLKSKDGKRRAEAAEELGSIGPAAKDVIPALLQAFKDAEGMVRVRAADAVALEALA
jgi:HEAT repeat protein